MGKSQGFGGRESAAGRRQVKDLPPSKTTCATVSPSFSRKESGQASVGPHTNSVRAILGGARLMKLPHPNSSLFLLTPISLTKFSALRHKVQLKKLKN